MQNQVLTNRGIPGGHVHNVEPFQQSIRVVQAVKNFSKVPGVCHLGLGTTATSNMKVLRAAGIRCEAWATQNAAELETKLAAAQEKARATGDTQVSHVIVSSPAWCLPADFKRMALEWMDTEFILENHSGCAYLSIDYRGIANNRECIDLQTDLHNFRVAANNTRVANWLSRAFGFECLYLPNLYDTTSFINPYPAKNIGGTIRIGSFGASRPWKNQLTAAEAGVQLARQLGVNLEFYVNSKRPDGGERMIESRKELFAGLRGCTLVEVPWEPWPQFRQTCGNMHLVMQPSFDETFNVVCADSIAAGTACVTSSAIEWSPQRWWANTCDPADLVRVATHLLSDQYAVNDGRVALTAYVQAGLQRWKAFLLKQPAAKFAA